MTEIHYETNETDLRWLFLFVPILCVLVASSCIKMYWQHKKGKELSNNHIHSPIRTIYLEEGRLPQRQQHHNTNQFPNAFHRHRLHCNSISTPPPAYYTIASPPKYQDIQSNPVIQYY